MLLELAVRDLGVIDDLRLVLGPGMTALTGETGAGKTLLVEAIELLLGGRADGVLVRPGATEAYIEGRFEHDGEEVVLSRAVPADGRSRAYIDGRMATAAALAELGAQLVEEEAVDVGAVGEGVVQLAAQLLFRHGSPPGRGPRRIG